MEGSVPEENTAESVELPVLKVVDVEELVQVTARDSPQVRTMVLGEAGPWELQALRQKHFVCG